MAPSTSTYVTPGSPTGARDDPNPPTTASFSPAQSLSSYQRRSVLVHQNTPLLIATPPQVTRALAFSHPFLLPLNKFVGLIAWASGDPWESFLLVAAFWAVTLFGRNVLLWAGPLLAVAGLMAGMYARRYSPLSTRSEEEGVKRRHRHSHSEGLRHQKSLDEIVDTLNTFTARCNLMLNPLLELTDFLSTQQTATSATTRPALTTLFIRLLLTLPLWIALTLPPLCILTAQRVVLLVGTIFLTWHSRPARISRTILWRSLSVRYLVALVTGLEFAANSGQHSAAASLLGRRASQASAAMSAAEKKRRGAGTVRFTFAVYENQRRWLGIGWTASMFAYERAAWTDEHLNPAPPKERFQLPSVEGGATWRWVEGSEWHTEAAPVEKEGKGSRGGWIYYDNKWNDPRRQDGWNRYTRRRKWYRDAELAEADDEADGGPDEPSLRGRADTAGSMRSIGSTSTKGTTGPTELPASEPPTTPTPIPKNKITKPAPTSKPASTVSKSITTSDSKTQLLAPTITATTTTGADADDGASIRSSATPSTRRRGLFHRRSRSRETRPEVTDENQKQHGQEGGEDKTPQGQGPRTEEEGEPRGSLEDDEKGWLVGDDVRMGLG